MMMRPFVTGRPSNRSHALLRSAWRFALAAMCVAIVLLALFAGVERATIFTHNLYPRKIATLFLLIAGAAMLVTAPIPRLRPIGQRFVRALVGISGAVVIIALLNRWFGLHNYLSDDEFVYLFQAKTLAAGRLWNAAPLGGLAFAPRFVGVAAGKLFGMYPPGWPSLLAVSVITHIPPVLLAATCLIGTIACLAILALPRVGRTGTLISVAIFALTPFTIFNGSSLYSHTLCACLIAAALAATEQAIRRSSMAYAVLAGCAIGLLGVTRSLSAVIVIGPVVVALLLSRDRVRLCGALGLGGLPFVALLMAYQQLLTGNPFRSPYWLAGRTVDHLYFDLPSILHGIALTPTRIMELCLWTNPLVLVLWAFAVFEKIRTRRIEPIDFVFPLAFAIYVFYPMNPALQFGPRYFYDFWPLAALTIATGLLRARPAARGYGRALALLSCVYGLYAWPLLMQYYGRQPNVAMQIEAHVRQDKLSQAIICIRGRGPRDGDPASSDLSRNDIDSNAPVLFAQCDLMTPAQLASLYPHRSIWVWGERPRRPFEELFLADLQSGSPTFVTPATMQPIDVTSAKNAGRGGEHGLVGRLAGAIMSLIERLGLTGIALLMAIESACIPLPSEVIMPFAGYLASLGKMSLVAAATAGALGCNLGSIPAYWVGRSGGRAVVLRWGRYALVGQAELDRAEAFFTRFGDAAVLIGRLLPIIRSYIAFPAGMARMSQLRFHIYTFVGSWPWCFGLAYVGERLGQAWQSDPRLKAAMHGLDLVVLIAGIGAVAVYVHHRRNRLNLPVRPPSNDVAGQAG